MRAAAPGFCRGLCWRGTVELPASLGEAIRPQCSPPVLSAGEPPAFKWGLAGGSERPELPSH